MVRRLGVFGSAGSLLASAFVAVMTVGMSAAHAASFEDWAVVSAGGFHTCGVRKNGKLYCWGSDYGGEVGDGGTPGIATAPRRIGTFEDWATVSAGKSHTCGVRKNGKLYCWGEDSSGQVGDGESTSAISPRRIGTFEDWATVSAGYFHSCGARRNGKLYCWGRDNFGQVGDGGENLNEVNAPRRIGTFEDWATVSAGQFHTCGVRQNSKLYCWGLDTVDQIGDGDNPDPATAPRRIGSFEDWAAVTAGGGHTCGIGKSGKLYCWGSDAVGQVGEDGDATVPLHIGTFEDWATVAAGDTHNCHVRTNGKLYCWGSDSSGQVGDGDGSSAFSPRRIGTFADWAGASTGYYHSCGIRHGGKLYCWGEDSDGQVGDGNNPDPALAPRRI